MNTSLIHTAGISDQGRVRSNNEDCFAVESLWNGKLLLLLVIDGCGGYEGGEIASSLARESILDFLTGYTGNPDPGLLKHAVIVANNRICEAREQNPAYQSMGCVLTAALIEEASNTMTIAHVGDSRCYVFDGTALNKLTRDHSLVGELEDEGYLTEREAMHHPGRSIIDRMVGEFRLSGAESIIETHVCPLPANCQILLCSDGLTDQVCSREIRAILSTSYTLEEKVRCLVNLANSKGGQDNITVVLAEKQR